MEANKFFVDKAIVSMPWLGLPPDDLVVWGEEELYCPPPLPKNSNGENTILEHSLGPHYI